MGPKCKVFQECGDIGMTGVEWAVGTEYTRRWLTGHSRLWKPNQGMRSYSKCNKKPGRILSVMTWSD